MQGVGIHTCKSKIIFCGGGTAETIRHRHLLAVHKRGQVVQVQHSIRQLNKREREREREKQNFDMGENNVFRQPRHGKPKEMCWLIVRATISWERSPRIESGISHNDSRGAAGSLCNTVNSKIACLAET